MSELHVGDRVGVYIYAEDLWVYGEVVREGDDYEMSECRVYKVKLDVEDGTADDRMKPDSMRQLRGAFEMDSNGVLYITGGEQAVQPEDKARTLDARQRLMPNKCKDCHVDLDSYPHKQSCASTTIVTP